MANGAEVARAYVTIVPTMQGAQAEITKELTGVTDTAAKSAGESGGSNFGANFASAIKGTAAVITGALVAATTAAVGAATAAGKAFIDAAKSTASYGDTVDKASQRLQISRTAYQELDYVLQLCGTSMDSMSTGFKTLNNKIADARSGSKEAQEMFKALGISMNDVKNLSTEDLFKAAINGLQDMGESADRAALANDLFGRSGQNLAPLLNMTSEEMNKAIQTANDYGMILSDEGVAASAQFTDSMTTMEMTVDGLKNSMMANFLPAMSSIMDGISQIFSGDKAGADIIKKGITELISKVSTYAPIFFELAQTIIEALFDGFAPMLPEAVTSIFSFLNMALIKVSGMIPQLTPVIQQGIQGVLSAVFTSLPIILSALIDLITDIVTWLSQGNTVNMLVDGVMELVTILADSLTDVMPILLPALVEIIGKVAVALTEPKNIDMILDSILTLVGAIVVTLVKCIPQIISVVGDLFRNIWGRMQNENARLISLVVSFVTSIRTKISEAFENIKTSIANVFTHIAESVGNIKTKVGTLVTAIIDKIKELPSKVVSIGKDLVEGLWNGINDKISWVKNKIKSMGTTITNAIKGVFGIHSPSKVWREQIGQNLGLSVGLGFSDVMSDVKSDMVSEMNGLTYSMNGTVTAYGTDSSLVGSGSVYNGGGVTINVYGAEGQDVSTLAEIVAQKLGDITKRKELAYA